MSRADDLLAGLNDVLAHIARVLPVGRQRYDADELMRLAVQRLWITTGNLAEQFRLAAGLPDGTEPWTELYLYRCILAHALPEELSDERIWEESTRDLERLRRAVLQALEGGGSSACGGSQAVATPWWPT